MDHGFGMTRALVLVEKAIGRHKKASQVISTEAEIIPSPFGPRSISGSQALRPH
jgi:hypothetical protein